MGIQILVVAGVLDECAVESDFVAAELRGALATLPAREVAGCARVGFGFGFWRVECNYIGWTWVDGFVTIEFERVIQIL